MKKLCTLFLVSTLALQITNAQSPQALNYQAIARNSSGAVLDSQNISLRFTIHDGTPIGTPVYRETHIATTNQFGLFTVLIGNGTAVSGTFSSIIWGTGAKYLQVEIDATGNTTFTDMGTSQVVSVPYALYAANSPAGNSTISGTTDYVIKFTGPTAGGNSKIFDNGTNVGIGTATPASLLDISALQPDARLTWTSTASFGRLLFAQSGTLFSSVQQVGSTYSTVNRQNALEIQNLTATGPLSLWTNGTEQMRIKSNGRIGMGTTTPFYKLQVEDTTTEGRAIYGVNTQVGTSPNGGVGVFGSSINADGWGNGVIGTGGKIGTQGAGYAGANPTAGYGIYGVAFGTAGLRYGVFGTATGGATNYGVFCNGSGGYSGTWTLISDQKFKTDLAPVSSALALIGQLNPVSYRLKKDEYPSFNFPAFRQYGFVAQELEKVIPLLVENASHPGATDENTVEEYKSVNYIGMVPILTKAIQELNAKIERLNAEIEALKKK